MENHSAYLIPIVAGAVLAIVVLVLRTYNRLVRLRLRLRNAWADIDVELKRRHDLVPQLVETVRGYMGHERQIFDTVAQARVAVGTGSGEISARAAAEMQFAGAIRKLLLTVERYPELKAVENFRLLHEQLVSTENRVAFARQHYNEAVRQYNTALATFPANAIGPLLGFSAAAMFAGASSERAVPQV